MKRREFTLGSAAVSLSAATLWPLQALAAGKGYVELKEPVETDAPEGEVEVIEFFSYGCIHCMRFAPILEKWHEEIAPRVGAHLRLVHVGFNKAFEPLQKIYLALEASDQVDKVHEQVFHALQEEKVRLTEPKVLFKWMDQQGVDVESFRDAYDSFGVATQVKRSIELQDAYAVEGTPAFGIAGKYYTDGSMAGGFSRMLQIANELSEQERQTA